MTQDAKTNQESTENVEQSQSTEKAEQNMVPSYRLKEEADKRRAAENKVAEFEKQDQTRQEAEMDAIEKLKLRDQKITELEDSISRGKLTTQFVDLVKEKGYPEKIAKLATPKDLSADTLLDSVKKFDKEYKEFKTPADTKGEKADNAFFGIQPETSSEATTKKMSDRDILNGAASGK